MGKSTSAALQAKMRAFPEPGCGGGSTAAVTFFCFLFFFVDAKEGAKAAARSSSSDGLDEEESEESEAPRLLAAAATTRFGCWNARWFLPVVDAEEDEIPLFAVSCGPPGAPMPAPTVG